MRAKVSKKTTVLLVIGILSIVPGLIGANLSETKRSTGEIAPPSLKTSATGKIDRIVDEFQVNDYMTDYQSFPSTCALSSDSFAVAWISEGQDGDSYGVYATVINATTGNNLTAEFRVNNYTTGYQGRPSVCALSSESFAVAWHGEGNGDSIGVYATVINATTGENLTAEFRVNDYTSSNQEIPSTCALSNESFAVVWTSYNQDGNGKGIYAKVINAITGDNLTTEFRVNDYTTSHQESASPCALSSDSFAVAWQSYGQDGSMTGVYATVFNATSGTNLTAEFRVNDYTADSQSFPSTCALSNETFALVWGSNQQDGDSYDIYATVIDATTGDNLIAEFQVNDYSTGSQYVRSICALSNDTIAVTWHSWRQDGDLYGVITKVISPTTGTSITSEFIVNEYTSSDQWWPSTCALSNETFAVVWESLGQDGSFDGIYATILGLSSGGGSGSPDIPGYESFFLVGIALAMSAILIKKRHCSKL